MKYFTWRNLFVVVALLVLLWYTFNHQAEVKSAIEKMINQIFG